MRQNRKQTINNSRLWQSGFALVVFIGIFTVVFGVKATSWVNPSQPPPNSNIAAPLNEGTPFNGEVSGSWNTLKLVTGICSANQALIRNGTNNGWICGASAANDLLSVLNAGSNASSFPVSGNATVYIGSATSSANLWMLGGEIRSKWLHADELSGNNSIMGNLGVGTETPNNLLQVVDLIDFNNANYNTKLGYQAGKNIGSGSQNNTFVGYQAGLSGVGSTGFINTAIGAFALQSNTSGNSNIAVGHFALRVNATGNANTAVGRSALQSNTDGQSNTAVGFFALFSNQTGNFNTAVGFNSLSLNTGSNNTANGFYALQYNTAGNNNTANGYAALQYNNTGSHNTAIGLEAGAGRGTPAHHSQGGVYVGYQAGYSAGNDSDYNTLIGYRSGYGISSGVRNVLIGQSTISDSYNQVTIGSNNIAIGDNVAVASPTANNQLNIGNLIYGTGLNGTGSTISTGNIGIGTKSPNYPLEVVKTNAGAETIPVMLHNNSATNGTTVSLGFEAVDSNAVTGKIANVRVGSGDYRTDFYNYTSNLTNVMSLYKGAVLIGAITNPADPNGNMAKFLVRPAPNVKVGILSDDADGNGVPDTAWLSAYDDSAQNNIPLKFNSSEFRFYNNINRLVTINSAGNVGIGIDAPMQKLEINGALKLDNTLRSGVGGCTAANVGVIVYEENANLGTFYGCKRTGLSTYAWQSL